MADMDLTRGRELYRKCTAAKVRFDVWMLKQDALRLEYCKAEDDLLEWCKAAGVSVKDVSGGR